jgi:hypothetical protein
MVKFFCKGSGCLRVTNRDNVSEWIDTSTCVDCCLSELALQKSNSL